ncbi:protein PLASTID MOVEMENT IMPAIRED 1-RELATED 1 [Andrographis paniculata]|uniref:protein PLASTID MOVEMENT IMPAIRED 1-RELATED 1 n=1 Tax=Andrographis paniculata TaxID=175694 RepID=UPI0021E934BF|nr:protein PLASTID MOVEMENT IMPAIRED 1-RELATED 1 [Andrographis paniculata]
MSSKADSRKKVGGSSGNGKLLSDLETLSKAYYVDKSRPRLTSSTASSRSKSVDKTQLPIPKTRPVDSRNKTKDSSEQDKKSSIWSWKGLKALTHARSRRFNCCFSLLVHNIEGLPDYFDNVRLVVHWKRRDDEQTTSAARVYQGVAEFDEQLTHTCLVYGSRNGPHHSAKYEAKHFLLFVTVCDAPEVDLKSHRIDLTRLLPLTLEELEEEKSSGKWTTSFRLSGKAKGATINVSFGYDVIESDNTEISANKNAPEYRRLQQNNANMAKLHPSKRLDSLDIYRVGSLPEMSSSSNQSPENFKDLHEVLPTTGSELRDSVNILYQKLDEEISCVAANNRFEDDKFVPSQVEPDTVNLSIPPNSGENVSEPECEISCFSVIDKGIEELTTNEKVRSEDELLNVAKNAGDSDEPRNVAESADDEDEIMDVAKNLEDGLELSTATDPVRDDDEIMDVTNNPGDGLESSTATDPVRDEDEIMDIAKNPGDGLEPSTATDLGRNEDEIMDVAKNPGDGLEPITATDPGQDEDVALHPSFAEVVPQNDDPRTYNFNQEEKGCDMDSKELLMREIEAALNSTSDFVDEDFDFREDSETLDLKSSVENESNCRDHRQGKSPCLDDTTDSVASDFLKMLGMEHSPFGLSSESEPESPRERLLRQFEKDALAHGGLLNFDIDDDPAEVVSDIPTGSAWETLSEDFYHSSIFEGFKDTSEVETDAFKTKPRGLRMEDLETEALMREWGFNENAFQNSPPSGSGGFGNPIDIPPEDLPQLPPLAEGLGPFVQTKDGGFIRSMNPALFKNAKSGGNLIMQVSNPVVVPAEMGSGVMDILQGLASVGIEKLSMQANRLMPLEDITGKTIEQISWDSSASLDGPDRSETFHPDSEISQSIHSEFKGMKGAKASTISGSYKTPSKTHSSDAEYVSLEDLAPLAMDKIEALSMEGLRIQSGMSDEEAPSNITAQSIGEFSALKGQTVNAGGSIALDGTGGLQLLDVKDNGEDVDGLMSLSLTLDEWVKLDSGEIDDDDLISERTSKVLAAHHATSLDQFRGRSKGEKRRGRSRKYGLLGNNFTVALMVQLRDPLRDYEPVGAPMLALIQVERVFVPPKPKLYSTVSFVSESNEDDEAKKSHKTENVMDKPKDNKITDEELIPRYKVSEVHVAGLKTEPSKKKLWGSTNQQQAGSRWLLANGMGKKDKHPAMKSKASSKSSGLGQPRDTLWSVSSGARGKGTKSKEVAGHNRNPNLFWSK